MALCRIIAIAIRFTLLVLIAQPVAADFWSDSATITDLYPTGSYLVFITDYSNPVSTCNDGRRFRLNPASPDYRTQAAAIMSAFYARKLIVMYIQTSGTPACEPIVNRFTIH